LTTLFACISPEVAINFFRNGKGVEIGGKSHVNWNHIGLAIRRIGLLDRATCIEIVESRLNELRIALYELTLDAPASLLAFFRTLNWLSENLFETFLSSLDLDDALAQSTIKQLATNQTKERANYKKIARVGRRVGGNTGILASAFLERLESAIQSNAHKKQAG
jgi:hypothetical protein